MARPEQEADPRTEARQSPAAKRQRGRTTRAQDTLRRSENPGNPQRRTPPPPTESRASKAPASTTQTIGPGCMSGPNSFSSATPPQDRDPLKSAPLFTKERVFNNSTNPTTGTWAEPPDTGAAPQPQNIWRHDTGPPGPPPHNLHRRGHSHRRPLRHLPLHLSPVPDRPPERRPVKAGDSSSPDPPLTVAGSYNGNNTVHHPLRLRSKEHPQVLIGAHVEPKNSTGRPGQLQGRTPCRNPHRRHRHHQRQPVPRFRLQPLGPRGPANECPPKGDRLPTRTPEELETAMLAIGSRRKIFRTSRWAGQQYEQTVVAAWFADRPLDRTEEPA